MAHYPCVRPNGARYSVSLHHRLPHSNAALQAALNPTHPPTQGVALGSGISARWAGSHGFAKMIANPFLARRSRAAREAHRRSQRLPQFHGQGSGSVPRRRVQGDLRIGRLSLRPHGGLRRPRLLELRVFRGGAYFGFSRSARWAVRSWSNPGSRIVIGFRVALSPFSSGL